MPGAWMPTLSQQQKGEKMPTFEEQPRPGSAAAADDLVTWLDDNLANEEDAPFERRAELIEDALVEAAKRSHPAASEEQGLRKALAKIVAEYDAWMKVRQVMPTHGLINAIVAGEAALQSVPSSPPQYIMSAPDPQSRTIASGMAQDMATWAGKGTAEPSDARQLALEKLRELVSHFEVKAIYYAELLEETGNLNFAGKQNAYEHAAEAVKIKLTELSQPPRTCQEEQD